MIKFTQPVKGFRDFLPSVLNSRQFVLGKIVETFRLFGFEPLETPALEYAAVLKGKYGEDEKLIYEFKTKGGDEVALRYDQTVPLARVIASYPELPKPFKRYQIQPVWRGENPQKGRFREFLQCDIDTVGSSSPLADAEIIACVLTVMKNLGFKNSYLEINDRQIFEGIASKYVAAIDKLKKIGDEGVVNEMIGKGLSIKEAKKILNDVVRHPITKNLEQIFNHLEQMGFQNEIDFKFTPTLARGLDYYTSTIFELISPEYGQSSLGGGGRFDKLIGLYSGEELPAVGFAFGFDRLNEAASELKLIPQVTSSVKVLVTIFQPELTNQSISITSTLRFHGINCEIWLDSESKLSKQLKYADQKGIPYVAIIGPDEAKNNKVTLKDLVKKTQETLTLDEVVSKLSS